MYRFAPFDSNREWLTLKGKDMIQIMTKETLAVHKPAAKSKPGFRLMEHLRFVEQSPGRTVVEFMGTNYILNTLI